MMKKFLLTASLGAACAAFLAVQAPARSDAGASSPPPAPRSAAGEIRLAQFSLGRVLGGRERETDESATDCEQEQQRNRRRGRGIGSVLGGIAGAAGVPVVDVLPVGSLLGEAIASLLDCKEQEQAATATQDAIRGGVGTTATWNSETRANVSGASTVQAEERLADGSHCMTVTDVVIIDGEETTAPKRMCRSPGSSGYVRV